MMQNESAIASEIKNHMKTVPIDKTYVGITDDPQGRLFDEHMVTRNNANWIYRDAGSASAARNIEDYFINTVGTKGDTGGGNDNSKYVYAYEITNSTRE